MCAMPQQQTHVDAPKWVGRVVVNLRRQKLLDMASSPAYRLGQDDEARADREILQGMGREFLEKTWKNPGSWWLQGAISGGHCSLPCALPGCFACSLACACCP